MLRKVLKTVNRLVKARPLQWAIGFGSVKYMMADYIAQTQLEGKNIKTINWTRFGLFTTFGAVYVGGFQYYVYARFYPYILRNVTQFYQKSLYGFIIDMTIYSPIIYYPIFYCFRDGVYHKNVSLRQLRMSMLRYKRNFKEDYINLWMVWGVPQITVFTVIPLHFRVPFISGVGFVWGILLSNTRGEKDT